MISDSRTAAVAIATRLSRLFLRFPSAQVDEVATAAYVADLIGFPLWAIDKAIIRAIQTPAQFVPSSPMIRAMCEQELEPIRAEAAAIREVLDAQIYREPSASERQETQRKFDELIAELKLRAPLDPLRPKDYRPPTRQEAEQWLEREKLNPHCPEPSDLLRAKLGLSVEKIGDAA